MLREIMTHSHKAADATYKADAAMRTGMGVVKNFTDHTADLPTAASSANLFFVQKARVPKGVNAALTNMSDYHEDFNAVEEGELVVLYSFDAGEQFATDAAVTTLTDSDIGKALAVGTDGKFALAAKSTSSHYVYRGKYNDAGHILCWVEVMDTPVASTEA